MLKGLADSRKISTYEKRWGEGAVDLKEYSLPSLKVGWVVERLPKRPLDILDYGCGEGKLLNTLFLQENGYRLFGTDIQKPRNPSEKFSFFLKKSDDSPLFEGQQFDRIISIDVLEHVQDIPTCLQQIDRQLKPDGEILFFIPAEGQPISFYNFYRLIFGKDLFLRTKEHFAYSRKQLIDMIGTKFDLVEVNYAYHFLGSIMDATFFTACLIPSVLEWWWTKNTLWRPNEKKGLASRILEFANFLCYMESRILRKVGFGSSGVLVHAKKKPQQN